MKLLFSPRKLFNELERSFVPEQLISDVAERKRARDHDGKKKRKTAQFMYSETPIIVQP